MDVFTLETDLFPCLVDMRFKGVRVDLEKAQNIKLNLIKREETLIKKIKDLTGVHVEIMAARSIAKAFDIPFFRTTVTKETKAAATKQQLALLAEHEVDFVVLARYMQIIPTDLIAAYRNKIINIFFVF